LRHSATAIASRRAPNSFGYRSRSQPGSPITRTLSSADASLAAPAGRSVRSFRSSFVRIAHGRSSPPRGVLESSSSHGIAAVPLSSWITVAALLPMNGSRSTGTRRLKSVRPICSSALALFEAVEMRFRMSGSCVACARTSLRARFVSIV
jgi:hypothetical protein